MAFGPRILQPLHRLVPGVAGESCALFIAKNWVCRRHVFKGRTGCIWQLENQSGFRRRARQKEKHVILPEGPEFGNRRKKRESVAELAVKFTVGDSVLVALPDKRRELYAER